MIDLHIAENVSLRVDRQQAEQLHAQLQRLLEIPREPDASVPESAVVLADDDAAWDRHSGGAGHEREEWTAQDLDAARTLRRSLSEKATVLFDDWISNPGRVFSVDEIVERHPEHFDSSRAVAGALKSIGVQAAKAERSIPFRWWRGTPTTYAVRPSVAAIFVEAGR